MFKLLINKIIFKFLFTGVVSGGQKGCQSYTVRTDCGHPCPASYFNEAANFYANLSCSKQCRNKKIKFKLHKGRV